MTENALTPELEKEIRRIVREEMQAAKREEQEFNSTRTCAYCEGAFPERALDYSSGDPACRACQSTIAKGLRPIR